MKLLEIVLGILGAIIVFGIYTFFTGMKMKKSVTTLSQDEFIQGYRKAQLIDVREPKEFEGGHILGARNIPASQIRTRMKEIRKDKPVYLYCQSGARSARTAMTLKKNGYDQLYQLDGGFRKWTGKIKSK
ncbi:rhodanese-like domain-containing protein [Chryseomicrobium excrementi]|uniref:Rhodanese-like domain-containing protein n=1 Tax=Chryseomicrobium excrementi TaxID=2041346 RepID=A0A2M9F2A4_9BACL|nr:rhodanese-like domain-containing protein [Chryseomicrobium excrementi]PJK17598.1 rhodanese-like domain-containing protein [Chryseomicrobium excrementi]